MEAKFVPVGVVDIWCLTICLTTMYVYIYIYIYTYTYIYIYILYMYIYIYLSISLSLYIYIYIFYIKVFKEIKVSMFEAIALDVVFFNCIIHKKPILYIHALPVITLYKVTRCKDKITV